MLENEPSSLTPSVFHSVVLHNDTPAYREQLSIPVLTSNCKEAVDVVLTHEDMKKLSEKNVEKYYKRWEGCAGAKTTQSLSL